MSQLAQAPKPAVERANPPPAVEAPVKRIVPTRPIERDIEPKTKEEKITRVGSKDFYKGTGLETGHEGAIKNLENYASDLLYIALTYNAKNNGALKASLEDPALSKDATWKVRDENGKITKENPIKVNKQPFKELNPGVTILDSVYEENNKLYFKNPATNKITEIFASSKAEKDKILALSGLKSKIQELDQLITDTADGIYARDAKGKEQIQNKLDNFFANPDFKIENVARGNSTEVNQKFHMLRNKWMLPHSDSKSKLDGAYKKNDTSISADQKRNEVAAIISKPYHGTREKTKDGFQSMLFSINKLEQNKIIREENSLVKSNLDALLKNPEIQILKGKNLADNQAVPINVQTINQTLPDKSGKSKDCTFEQLEVNGGTCTVKVNRIDNKGKIDFLSFKLQANPTTNGSLNWSLIEVEGEPRNIALLGDRSKAQLAADTKIQNSGSLKTLIEAFNATSQGQEIPFLRKASKELFERYSILEPEYQLLNHSKQVIDPKKDAADPSNNKVTLSYLKKVEALQETKYFPETLEITFLKPVNRGDEEPMWAMRVQITKPEGQRGTIFTLPFNNADLTDPFFKNPSVKEIFDFLKKPAPLILPPVAPRPGPVPPPID